MGHFNWKNISFFVLIFFRGVARNIYACEIFLVGLRVLGMGHGFYVCPGFKWLC